MFGLGIRLCIMIVITGAVFVLEMGNLSAMCMKCFDWSTPIPIQLILISMKSFYYLYTSICTVVPDRKVIIAWLYLPPLSFSLSPSRRSWQRRRGITSNHPSLISRRIMSYDPSSLDHMPTLQVRQENIIIIIDWEEDYLIRAPLSCTACELLVNKTNCWLL